MKLKKISIQNFKSIKDMHFDIKKHGNSYTSMLLGINESGKSNILEAMSFLNTPDGNFDFDILHHQKDEESEYIDLYFHFLIEKQEVYTHSVQQLISDKEKLLHFTISEVSKNVYLRRGDDTFTEEIHYEIKNLTNGLYIKEETTLINKNGQQTKTTIKSISKENDAEGSYIELTEEVFNNYFEETIIDVIKENMPTASFWKPSENYLISSDIDLNSFSTNTSSNIPLRNIFSLSGYTTDESIRESILKLNNPQHRSRLASRLSEYSTQYVNKIWNHKIELVIEISENMNCTMSIKDAGKFNKHDRHSMDARSEGFKQFMSLILSLSIESRQTNKQNRLILIDEPENHLHPSGIRDLGRELIEIGKNDVLFVSTHSPFLIDTKTKERNSIVKKNNYAATTVKTVSNHDDIRGDEVLMEAFGISVYKELLNKNRILAEGKSDQIIIQKALAIKNFDASITNGTGSNIVAIASLLKNSNVEVLVVVDDDDDGLQYKNKIISIGGPFKNKVFTLKDISKNSKNKCTIEDLLNPTFIRNTLCDSWKNEFNEECNINIDPDKPIIDQVKKYLHQNNKSESMHSFIDALKVRLSEDFDPNTTSLKSKSPLLNDLAEGIISELSS